MINLILFGPPGSGKGTQAELIVKDLALNHISTGDVFRKNIREKTDLGKLAVKYMDQGKLVPDEVTIDLLSQELDNFSHSKGFIFDGFPRTIPQAVAFEKLFFVKKITLSMVISLEVKEQELVNRLLKRGISSGRADDQNEEIIRNRIKVYEKQTSVLKTYYTEKLEDKFFSIDGECDIEDIFYQIKNIIINYSD